MTVSGLLAARPITEIWVALGGDHPKHGRARAFYRDGDNPQAVSLNDAKACWYDYRDNIGGGVLDLIQHVLGCDRSTALHWLADFTGLALDDRPLTAAERRAYGRLRARVEQLARDVADFECGLELFLERRQKDTAAVISGLLGLGVDPSEVFAGPTRDLAILRKADADSLVHAYRELPEAVRRPFRDAGRRDREHAEGITRAIVSILTQVGSDKASAA
jgi:hypothetical protein